MSLSQNQEDVINIGHGDPTIFRSWWLEHNILPEISTQHVPLYEYQEEDFSRLIKATHDFHSLFGTDSPSSSIVYGNGSTQVINAVLYAISKKLQRPIIVGYEPPVYMLMHEFLLNCKMVEVTFDLNRSDIDVEIVIDPNNPSGEHRCSKSSAKYVVFDRAYNWPIYLDSDPIPTSTDSNHITVYTISKALGMGGLRLGWCFVNDDDLTQEIQRALFVIGICPNSFGMEATISIFNRFINDAQLKHDYIDNMGKIIKYRRTLLSMCHQFTVVNKTGPYAWIKAHNENIDITDLLLRTYSIKVYSGVQFGSTPNYARLSLICDSDDFTNAIKRLFYLN